MLKRLMLVLSLAIGVLMVTPAPDAEARGWGWNKRPQKTHDGRRHKVRRGFGVPELDPGAAGSAIVLLIGGVAYIASRRREEDAT